METLYPQDKTDTNEATAVGGMTSFDLRASALSGRDADAILRAPVQGVRFEEIISFLIDNFNDTIAVASSCDSFAPAAHDAAWDRKFAKRTASMIATEHSLLTAAMISHVHAPEFGLHDWLKWDDAQRTKAVTETVEGVTRLYVLHYILSTYGRRLTPYQRAVINMIQQTHFCTASAPRVARKQTTAKKS